MKKYLSIIALISLMSSPTLAGPFDPGLINKQNLDQIEGFKNEKQTIEPVGKKDFIKKQKKEQEIDTKKETLKGDLTYNPQFKLNKIIFQGNTIYKDKKLQKIAKNLIGKDVFLEDIMDLTIDISRYYQKHGYLTSYARLEPQEIKDGIVVITIRESKVSEKIVEGNRWEREWYLKNLALGGNGLSKGKVFNSKYLQGAMKNLNNEAYLKSSVEINKNPENDDTVIKLNIADRFPLNFDVAWDDYGRNYTGRQRATMMLGMDNLTGLGDKVYGGTILASGTTGALAGYQIPISPYGTKLAFDYSYSKIDLGGPYKAQGINGRATSYALRLIQPLKNTANTELNASVAIDALNARTDMSIPSGEISDYRLRVLRSSLYGHHNHKIGKYFGRTVGSLGFDVGTTALGASQNVTNGPQSTFYKLVSSLARVQRLPKNLLGVIRINGQYSPQTLYAAEQMYLGGAYSVRGYQPSELIGDYGVAGSLELRTPAPFIKGILPKKIESWSDKVMLAAFYDWGFVREHNHMYDYPDNFLQSVGLGTYINITDAITVQLGVGIPVGQKYYNDDNARMYFSVNTDVDRMLMKPKEEL